MGRAISDPPFYTHKNRHITSISFRLWFITGIDKSETDKILQKTKRNSGKFAICKRRQRIVCIHHKWKRKCLNQMNSLNLNIAICIYKRTLIMR